MSTQPATGESDVMRALRDAIAAHGPITFDEFMEIALYGPGGYYERPPVGESGDFVTSPHVHPVFADLLADAVVELWDRMGRAAPLRVIELGAGDGSLARQLLAALPARPQLAGVSLEYVAVDRSPGARAALAELPVHVVPSLEVLDQHLDACIIANELLDNMPFHWLRGASGGPVELHVAAEGDHLAFVEQPANAELLDELPRHLQLAEGRDAAVSLTGLHLVDRLARMLHHGYALLIDYAWKPGDRRGGVHGYRAQHVVDDLLDRPGTADITAGVDFSSLATRAEQLGLQAFEPVTQRSALLSLGYGEWDRGERSRQTDLIGARAGRDAVRTWSDRNRAGLLVEETGLGRLRWLVLGTPDLEAPSWLREAGDRDAIRADP